MKSKLKDVSTIILGHVFREKIPFTNSGNLNLLNMETISITGFLNVGLNNIKKIMIKDLKNDEIIRPEDILFKAKGLVNNAVLVKKIPPNTTVTASCHIIRVTDKNFLPEYVCTWLNSATAKKYFSKCACQAVGVTISNVSKTTLEFLEIPRIPMKMQKLISDIEECAKQEKELFIKITDKKHSLYRAIIEKELQKY